MKFFVFALASCAATSAVQAMSLPFIDQTAVLFGWGSSKDISMSRASSIWKSNDGGDDGDDDDTGFKMQRHGYNDEDHEHRRRRRDERRHRRGGEGEGTIFDRLRKEKKFSKLVEILEENRGLRDDLERSDARLTMFAPTNEAIDRLKEELGRRHITEDDGDYDTEKRGEGGDGKKRRHEMDEIIRYHLCSEEMNWDDLYDGMTLKTDLKLRELDGNRQRIRVFKFKGDVLLNMYARVHQEEMEAENGVIMAVDQVLIPPPDMRETLFYLPTRFSTFLAAVQKVGLEKELEKNKAMTVFVPPNAAWESLGIRNLMYLFSERGHSDLKKVIEYHMGRKLVYADKMIEEGKFEMDTELKGQRLQIKVNKRREGGERCRRSRYSEDGDFAVVKKEGHCPADYVISINEGEATVTFTDAVAENGNIFLINGVLVPENIKMPHHHDM